MSDAPPAPGSPPGTEARHLLSADLDAARSFMGLSRGWWSGSTARQAWFWTLALASMILINVGVNVMMNGWHGWFFNALERKDAAAASMAMAAFPLIVVAAAAVGVMILKTRETLQVHWRKWLSAKLIDLWVDKRRFQRLGPSGLEPANPEYRIADDVRWATEPLVDFAIGLLAAIITVVTFVGILWGIGGSLTLGSGDGAVTIPAYLVLAAILYGIAVSALMLLVGRRLPQHYARRNESEAKFRFSLMRLRDSADAIAIGNGQFSERKAIGQTYDTLAARWLAVIAERAKLTWITNGSSALVPVVPLLLAAPKYLSGEMTLGSVVQVAAAFVQVQIAFNWILENFMRIAEWLASARRVNDLAEAIDHLEALPEESRASPRTIAGAGGALVVHDLVLKDRDGRTLAGPLTFDLKPGESLYLGSLGAEAASALLRALADQWSWGSGIVARDPEARIGAAAQRMRWAEARLGEVLAGPGPELRLDADQMRAVLSRVGLGHLSERLGETANWDNVLSEGERQRLAFARLHLAAPEIVLIDDALHALDEADAAVLFADLRASLPAAMLVTAGGSAVLETSASRTLDTGKALPQRVVRSSAGPVRSRKAGTG
ncbi:MAG: ATP-binding cassette domain-containing protein [Beijerinckiaceae bacterium]|nr:ATP-binding cassette domain-containing protein [Beijerinckiaceae bacterium]